MNSFRVFCGALALTTNAFGVWPTATTASKFFGLQESFRYSVGLMPETPAVVIIIV